jgi:hypothetical protein
VPHKDPKQKSICSYILTQALFKKSIDYLGSKCKICGNNNIHNLCFHHIDKHSKDFTLGGNRIRKSFDKVQIELDKCQLLCNNCHKELHFNENDIISYRQYKHRAFKNLLLSYKKIFNCELCGYHKCEAALEFHHINSSEKELQISKITCLYKSIEEFPKSILNELDKCQVLCSNCHQIQHTNLEKYNLYKNKIEEKSINYKKIKRVDNSKLIELYKQNISVEDIAKNMGHYPATIYLALYKNGLHL